MSSDRPYEALVAEALAASFEGWDFSWLDGRTDQTGPSWSYEELAQSALATATSALDIATGGGELLASFQPLPAHTVATEGWQPNVAVATRRLAPLGVEVRASTTTTLPARDGEFDLVLNRHGGFDAAEARRVLAPGGTLLMQHVGTGNDADLNAALGAPSPQYGADCAMMADELERAGFAVVTCRDENPEFAFYDIGAVIYHLRAVSWQIPDFDVQTYDQPLRSLDARIRSEGPFIAHDHRILIEAERK
jgi:SAM-dependent methyltransferase